jgi:acetyl esterase/lipase
MDVHRPEKPNGLGIIAVFGTGWRRGSTYAARPMKEDPFQLGVLVKPLVAAGYAVFVINHRAAPHFRYPAAIEDAERAVRFVRHHAARFGVSPDRIGAVGASSGGHLVSMLGVRSGKGDASDSDAVNRELARVQAVVAFCAFEDLTAMFPTYTATVIASFLGPARAENQQSSEWKLYQEASPIHHVTSDDAPLLLIHGDKDEAVPFEQSEKMESALRQAKVQSALIRVPGSGHGIEQKPGLPDFTTEMVRWFDTHLGRQK